MMTTGPTPEQSDSASPRVQSPTVGLPGRPEIAVGRAAGWLAGYLLLAALVGVGAGILWEKIVRLPGYRISSNGTATTTERGLTEFFGGDAWFCLIGFLAAVGLGIVAWKWFGQLGWPVVFVAVLGAVSAALICWWVGYQLGPGPFDPRLAAAQPGDFVPIALNLRSPVALLVWAFGAIIPVLLRASLGRDEEEEALPARSKRS
ncbi:hypothetical protein SAMN04489812_5663 [Microlunatus soli]|uniref:DUF2567 domain-containing protein n=2 Tax=Microlunatus soli TaxID=630515 RepID=A0A1H2A4L2_9ACTN|nr:hypothetical protein SAMN04489812_5663 [Microlunatus soli]